MKRLHIIGSAFIAGALLTASSVLGATGDSVTAKPIGELVQGALADTYTATSGSVATKVVINDPEFTTALQWMYNTQITRYNTQETYAPFNLVTREQAAKMLTQFFTTYVANPQRLDMSTCQFTDTTNADPTLKPYILDACQFSIFKGSAGKFEPMRNISKAELSAALIRMFSDGQLNESVNPRWSNYFTKAQELGMTKETNINNFSNTVSRYELALMLYRFKKIYADDEPITPLTPASTGSTITSGTVQPVTTGTTIITSGQTTVSGNTNNTLLNLIAEGTSVTDSVEFQDTVMWMYDNGLTKYTSSADFGAFNVLTREQAAKMLTQYRNLMFPGKVAQTPENCTFKDIGNADPTLVQWIYSSCSFNILKGGDGYFAPTKALSKPEAIAVLLRMFDQPQDETSSPRWYNYFTKANELGLISESSAANFDKPITRYEMSTLMYRLKMKQTLLNSLNTDLVQNKLITMIDTSNNLIVNTGDRARGYILMNTYLLENQQSDYFLIDVFGTTYKISKNSTFKYFDNQYVWYGDIYTLDGDEKIGLASFTINNNVVIEGVIRPFGEGRPSYFVGPTSTPPYYVIKQIVPVQAGVTTSTTSMVTSLSSGSVMTGSSIMTGSASTGSMTTGTTTP